MILYLYHFDSVFLISVTVFPTHFPHRNSAKLHYETNMYHSRGGALRAPPTARSGSQVDKNPFGLPFGLPAHFYSIIDNNNLSILHFAKAMKSFGGQGL